MRWPFISRSLYDEMLREKNLQIGKLEKELADFKKASQRQHDVVYRHNFGVQIYDTLAETAEAQAPERELTADEKIIKEIRDQQAEDERLIQHTRQSRPSQLPQVLAQIKARTTISSARQAHPEALNIFATAKQEVQNGNGTH